MGKDIKKFIGLTIVLKFQLQHIYLLGIDISYQKKIGLGNRNFLIVLVETF